MKAKSAYILVSMVFIMSANLSSMQKTDNADTPLHERNKNFSRLGNAILCSIIKQTKENEEKFYNSSIGQEYKHSRNLIQKIQHNMIMQQILQSWCSHIKTFADLKAPVTHNEKIYATLVSDSLRALNMQAQQPVYVILVFKNKTILAMNNDFEHTCQRLMKKKADMIVVESICKGLQKKMSKDA